jgi:endopolyphosphatase
MPNLDDANKTHKPRYELEYVTFPLERLRPSEDSGAEAFEYPIPPRYLPEELLDASVTKSKYAPYKMEDLTIPSWVRLAQRVADDKRVKLRKKFKKYMFAGAWPL